MKKMSKNRFVFLTMIASVFLVTTPVYSTMAHANANTPSTTATSAPASQDAINACSDKAKGDACAFTNSKGDSVDGHCGAGTDQSKLVCNAYQ